MEEKTNTVRPLVDLTRLRRKGAVKLWAGKGSGLACARCGVPIESSEIEYEIALGEATTSVRIHIECFAHWRAEIE